MTTTPAERPVAVTVGTRQIGSTGGVLVVLQFGAAARWVGLRPAEALELATALREAAQVAAATQVQ